jgi:TRAP transporter TAXI family solute receptor
VELSVSTRFRTARLWLAGILAVGAVSCAPLAAQEMKFFRIGTGGTAGTYFPIGGLIANAVSAPPGSRACYAGGACGVPGLVAIAIAADGAIANVNDIQNGRLEAGFTQSDVAYWAFTGTGVFEGREEIPDLRAIANLYPETVHIVVRRDSGIATVSDLKGKRVSLEEPGSGTLADARIILNAYGLSERDLKPEYLKPDVAGKKLAAGDLDAFFFVGGAPVAAITELAATTPIGLVPIGGVQAEKALTRYSFFAWDRIPAGTYPGIADVPTISVSAILVTSAKQDEELIHGVTEALWNANSRKLLDGGHAKGKLIVKNNATKGLGIPLHPGAERYYREVGLLPKAP